MIVDRQGRRFRNLRISLTAACNYACTYCVPDGKRLVAAQDELSAEAMVRGVAYLIEAAGIERLRITGGEPLVSPKLEHFLRGVSRLGLQDIGLTSNGQLLSRKLPLLLECGLKRINVSLDTLDPVAFKRIARGGDLPTVQQGLAEARAAGLKIKINMVPLRGQNHEQVLPMLDYCLENGFELRFIELMPVSTQDVLSEDNFLSTGVARKLVEQHYGPLTPLPNFKTNGPATYYEIASTGQKIGFIGAMTNLHFCEACNKLRLTSDGKLRPCLGSYLEFDLREKLRAGCSDAELADFIHGVVARKPKEHDFRHNYQPNRRMIAIGG